jgi:RecA-family ATPase
MSGIRGDDWDMPPDAFAAPGMGTRKQDSQGRKHSPFMQGGRPLDLQPLRTINVLKWDSAPVPERRWIVPDMIPEANVTMLGGDGGLGKSQLALQLLVATSLGEKWLGYPTRRCKSIGVFCEDDQDELHRRLAAILNHYGASFGDLEDLTLVSRVGEENTLVQFPDQWQAGATTALFTRIEHVARDGAELLVLDSLHDLFSGNENSRPHARQFVNALRSLALQMITGAVLLTAHPSLSGRTSGTGEAGSTAWNNTVRSRLYLTAPRKDDGSSPDRDYRELKTMKANYAASGGVLRLRWQDGVFVRDDIPTGIMGTIERRSAESAFLACLDALTTQGRRVNDGKMQANYAPKLMATMPEAERYRVNELAAAMNRLFSAGKIEIVEDGSPSRRRRCIGRTRRPENDPSSGRYGE